MSGHLFAGSGTKKLTREDPSVAVIILNWNGLKDTVACLESLRGTGYGNYRVVVVDNGSDGHEGTRLQEQFPEVHLIRNLTNRGFAGGNNDGIRWAIREGFDYVVNLNNDCLVAADWLEMLITGLRSRGADFATSQVRYFPETHLICSDENVLLPDGTGLVVNHLQIAEDSREIRPIFAASGAASIYSTACLEAVAIQGGQYFDELYFAYLEDLDLGIRLNVRGFKGVCVPEAIVYHKESMTSGRRSAFQIFHLEKNRMLVELLNYPLWMIPVGEGFGVCKTLVRLFTRQARKDQRQSRADKPVEKISPFKLLAGSRLWVLQNLPVIRQDRQDRERRGLIDRKVHRFFVWKLRRC